MEKYSKRQIEIMEATTARIDEYGIQQLTIKNLANDIGLSEPALYRHFSSKNDILLNLLNYFLEEMKQRINKNTFPNNLSEAEELHAICSSQLTAIAEKPAIVSVIFAENIFHFDHALSAKVLEIMDLMNHYIKQNIEKGQKEGNYSKTISASTLTTIIIGGLRLTVLKWKIGGHKSNILKDGIAVVEGILKMIKQ